MAERARLRQQREQQAAELARLTEQVQDVKASRMLLDQVGENRCAAQARVERVTRMTLEERRKLLRLLGLVVCVHAAGVDADGQCHRWKVVFGESLRGTAFGDAGNGHTRVSPALLAEAASPEPEEDGGVFSVQ
jgi:hypothetical protein